MGLLDTTVVGGVVVGDSVSRGVGLEVWLTVGKAVVGGDDIDTAVAGPMVSVSPVLTRVANTSAFLTSAQTNKWMLTPGAPL